MPEDIQLDESSKGSIEFNILMLTSTHNKCVFGHTSSSLGIVPPKVRFKVLVCHRLYIPSGVRICKPLLEEGVWSLLAQQAKINGYTPTQIQEMMDLFISNYSSPPFLDFEFVEAMGDKAVQDWTGLDVDQFNELFSALPSLIVKEKTRPKTAL